MSDVISSDLSDDMKNSWGTDANRNANGGYVYFSESYMRLKAVSITVHKDAVSKTLADKLHID